MYYPYVVRQQVLTGITEITCICLSILMFFCLGKYCLSKSNGNMDSGYTFTGMLVNGLAIIALIIATLTFSTLISQIINPHYYAVKEVIEIGSKLIGK